MRTIRLFLAAMLTAVGCTEVAAQGMAQSPKLSGDNKVEFTVRAPEAQKVQVDIGGTKYDMNKGEAGIWRVTTKPQVPGILSDTKTFNKQFDVFFLSCGEQDPRIEYTRNIVKTMRDGGVEVRFNSYPGDHEWQVWRKSLHEFAQYLFK